MVSKDVSGRFISLMSAAAVVILAVSCSLDDVADGNVMEDFSSIRASGLEVGNSTGVELVGLGVELDPHFLSQNVTRGDGATELDWKRTVVKRCTNMGVERYRVMVLPNWWEPYNDDDDPDKNADFSVKTMFTMAVATSIDALAVGISLAMAGGVNIWAAVGLIAVVTCILSALGVKIGSVFGDRFEKKAQIAGGVILIILGLKILLEHLGVL